MLVFRWTSAKWVTAIVLIVAGILPAAAPRAEASAGAKAVYVPKVIGNNQMLTGAADLARGCSGTYGCWNSIHFEREVLNWAMRVTPVREVGGSGRGHGAPAWIAKGRHRYRTVAVSTTHGLGPAGGGVTIGPVGATANGMTIWEVRKYPPSARCCR